MTKAPWLLCASLVCFMVGDGAEASEVVKHDVTFTWEYAVGENIGGFTLYSSNASGGPYEIVKDEIPYSTQEALQLSMAVINLTGLQGSKHRLYFVLAAYSKEGVRSAYSNEVSHTFVIPMGKVFNLTIDVFVQSTP